MKFWFPYAILFLLFAIAAPNSYAQQPTASRQDTIIPKAAIGHFKQEIYRYKEKAKLQEFELRVLREAAKVDSVTFGNDSLVIITTSAAGKPLKKVIQKFKSQHNNSEDSVVFYYNKNALVEYQEWWEDGYRQNLAYSSDTVWVKMKLMYRRYEYDDRNRLIRQVVHYPTPRTIEYTYTYDAEGNQTRNSRSVNLFHFWD